MGDQVVIDTKAAGLCHSDVGFLNGNLTPLLGFRPITLGHEIAGVVSAVGPDVQGFSVGDRVAVPTSVVGLGVKSHGGFAERALASEADLVAAPDNVTLEQAAVATDAGMSSYHAIMVAGRVKAGDRVGIIGLGGLGSLGAQIALTSGAEVYAADTSAAAQEYGRELALTGVAPDILAFSDRELDVVVDFVGAPTTTPDALKAVRPRGLVVQVGLGTVRSSINIQTLVHKQTTLTGSSAGTHEDCRAVLDLLTTGRIEARITQIGFDEIAEGVRRLEDGEVMGRLVATRPFR